MDIQQGINQFGDLFKGEAWQTWVIIGIVALIVFSMVNGVFRLVKTALLGVLVMQILYVLGQSRLNEFIDLASVFKYDVFTVRLIRRGEVS